MSPWVLFVGNSCPNCDAMKTFLKENDISISDTRNIQEDPQARVFMLTNRISASVPTLYNRSSGEKIIGFTEDSKQNILQAFNKL